MIYSFPRLIYLSLATSRQQTSTATTTILQNHSQPSQSSSLFPKEPQTTTVSSNPLLFSCLHPFIRSIPQISRAAQSGRSLSSISAPPSQYSRGFGTPSLESSSLSELNEGRRFSGWIPFRYARELDPCPLVDLAIGFLDSSCGAHLSLCSKHRALSSVLICLPVISAHTTLVHKET